MRQVTETSRLIVSEQEKEKLNNCSLGTRYTLGRPKKGHYRYLMLYPTKPGEAPSGLLAIDSLIGLMVVTKGIMKLKDGSQMLSLERLDKKPFYGQWTRIYSYFTDSLESGEIVPL